MARVEPRRAEARPRRRRERGLVSRRAFLAGCLASVYASHLDLRAWQRERPRPSHEQEDARQLARIGAQLRARFDDLPSHFVFEYYPWYGTDPWRHWEQGGLNPPARIASNYLPVLGPYDSRSAHVIEQHARWMLQAGVGAVNVSWWGPGTYEDRAVPLLMDVMKDHGIQVTFHLEPYAKDRATRLAGDIKYLLREYGERRRWDNFLLLERADGSAAPVMEMFEAIVPPTVTDCLGVTRAVPGYVPDAVWRQQTSALKREVAVDFEHFTLLADSLDVGRTLAGGFDGGTSSDPFFHPDRWEEVAGWFNAAGLPFVFGVNAGFDVVAPAAPPTGDPCYHLPRPEPVPDIEWNSDAARAREQHASSERIVESFERTLRLQTQTRSANARHGFFLVFINSFNEWHEGSQFEPMKSLDQLTADERRVYHNAASGSYRLDTLASLVQQIV
jgi:hypothetical protein